MKKLLVVGVIVLFLGVAIAPSINANVNKISVNPIPDLNCEGELTWLNLTQKATVTGHFTVENIGEEDSELDWEIESFPEWGNWSFNPDSWNNQKPEDGPVKVEVEVVAPDEITGDLGGMIKIINKENPDDFCEISAFWRKKSITAEMIEIVPKPFDLNIDDIKELIDPSKAFALEEKPFTSSESSAILGNPP